ncbi:MAG: AraC family transcriptional regulator [Bacteroidaceae bacterium]|nr:AraC family transcriptional regulator [Bacteroidaceae bacterium]
MNHFKYLQPSARDLSWGVAVTTIGWQYIESNAPYPANGHPDNHLFGSDGRRTLNEYQIVYIARGRGVFESASYSRTTVEAGTLLLLFPGEWHSYRPDIETGWEEYWVGFNGRGMDELIKSGFFTFKQCIFHTSDYKGTSQIFNDIYNCLEQSAPGAAQYASGLVQMLLGRIAYENQNKTHCNSLTARTINQAKRMITSDIYAEKSIEEIAEILGIGYSYFRREFRRICGIPPGEYRQQHRLQRAKELLISSTDSIAQIAMELKFDSAGEFSTFFRKREGIPPLEYRKTYNL